MFLILSAEPALGNESASVTARVTVASPCITVSLENGASSVDFGTLGFSTDQILGAGIDDSASLANCSSQSENISVRGTDATSSTSSATWVLKDTFNCSAGEINRYRVAPAVFATNPQSNGGQPVSNSMWLKTTDQALYTAAASASNPASLMLTMPCTGSDGAGTSMNFQVIYTASL
jgi:hypothetical protein